MRYRLGLATVGVGLLLSGAAGAQSQQPWANEAASTPLLRGVRGTVSFFYRSNELMGENGFTSFGPQFHLDGSLGDHVFYSTSFAYSRRERLGGDAVAEDGGGGDSHLVGGARLGFRLGQSSVFEVEYSNDSLGNQGEDSVLFLDGRQRSSIGGIERGKSHLLTLRNQTQIGSVAHLSTSVRYTDLSTSLQLAGASGGSAPQLVPDYLRRLEVQEHARTSLNLLGRHQIETGMRFVLDQVGLRSTATSLAQDDELQYQAMRMSLYVQDRWQLLRAFSLHMGLAYEMPGTEGGEGRNEWAIGLRRNEGAALQYGVTAFLRNGFPQLADYGHGRASVDLASVRQSNPYRDELGLGSGQLADYSGLELFLSRPLTRSFGFFLGYTYSQLRQLGQGPASYEVAFGTVESDVPSMAMAASSKPQISPTFEQTHMLHLSTSYKLSRSLQVGSTVNYLYADPMEFVTAEATLISPGTDHNISVDVHLEKIISMGGMQVGLMFDVFNLVDTGSMMPFDTRYDLDLAALSGRRFQLGMRYGF
jgi:hypothetical protein